MMNLFKIHQRSLNLLLKSNLSIKTTTKFNYSNLINESAKSITNQYTIRTHNCGEISKDQLNQIVHLAGWIQYSRFNKFFILRDKYGSVQLIIKDKNLVHKLKDKQINLKDISLESVVILKGLVLKRPDGEVNQSMVNGDIEIDVKELDLLNKCNKDQSPIDFNTIYKTPEDICLKYRYVTLRSTKLQTNLEFRSKYLFKLRKYLIEKLKFTEVETPTLFKNTPGGANEFVVPTRFKDKFYTLTQSPQQFKQLLMIGSIDKYFQIARCYRDELTRSDRQPEFTQLDLELSFTTSEHIQTLIEDLLRETWSDELHKIKTPFKKYKYSECMSKYGSDKPDLRLKKLQLIEQTDPFDNRNKLIKFKIYKGHLLEIDKLVEIKKITFEKLNHYIKLNNLNCFLIAKDVQGELRFEKIQLGIINDETNETINEQLNKQQENILNDLDLKYIEYLKSTIELDVNDCSIVCTGNLNNLREVMGRIRNSIIPLILENQKVSELNDLDEDKYSFLWVVDFPLFTINEDNELESNHHPFTAPIEEHNKLIYTDPLNVIGQHYDLVLNGNEIGGGSIRIHNYEMQKYVFKDILKSPDLESMNYFLDALNSGCPTHGGIALGLDRLLSIKLNTESIRDVIAFPKTTNGRDLMSDAPNELSKKSKLFYNL